jgi:hypothetical protein
MSAARMSSEVPKFDVVDAVTPVGTAPCAECRGPIVDTYYETDHGVICAACHTRIAGEVATQSTSGRFSRALGFGAAAATAGATIYFAVLAATGHEVSLLVLLVGFMVGKAVRVGARGRGGRRYQWLAVALTYLAVVTTYIPFVMKGFNRSSGAATTTVTTIANSGATFLAVGTPAPSAQPSSSLGDAAVDVGALLLLAAAAPVLEGVNNLLTLLVIVVALAQAWRMNRRVDVRMTGPYHVRAARA